MAGVRQANRIRHAYLASVLQQEVAFFDTDTSSGKLLNGLNEDTVTIQNAIGEKVGNFVHHLSTFLVGIAIGGLTDQHLIMVSSHLLLMIHSITVAFAQACQRDVTLPMSSCHGLSPLQRA